jgi:hypothetical protein
MRDQIASTDLMSDYTILLLAIDSRLVCLETDEQLEEVIEDLSTEILTGKNPQKFVALGEFYKMYNALFINNDDLPETNFHRTAKQLLDLYNRICEQASYTYQILPETELESNMDVELTSVTDWGNIYYRPTDTGLEVELMPRSTENHFKHQILVLDGVGHAMLSEIKERVEGVLFVSPAEASRVSDTIISHLRRVLKRDIQVVDVDGEASASNVVEV